MAQRRNLAAVCAAVALVGGLAACGGGDEDSGAESGPRVTENSTPAQTTRPPKPTVPTIVVENGEPVGGVEELEYSAGDRVRFKVVSDVADEVHVHGYEVEEEIPAGGAATLSFPADIEGIFEVELHGSEAQIAELRVDP